MIEAECKGKKADQSPVASKQSVGNLFETPKNIPRKHRCSRQEGIRLVEAWRAESGLGRELGVSRNNFQVDLAFRCCRMQ